MCDLPDIWEEKLTAQSSVFYSLEDKVVNLTLASFSFYSVWHVNM